MQSCSQLSCFALALAGCAGLSENRRAPTPQVEEELPEEERPGPRLDLGLHTAVQLSQAGGTSTGLALGLDVEVERLGPVTVGGALYWVGWPDDEELDCEASFSCSHPLRDPVVGVLRLGIARGERSESVWGEVYTLKIVPTESRSDVFGETSFVTATSVIMGTTEWWIDTGFATAALPEDGRLVYFEVGWHSRALEASLGVAMFPGQDVSIGGSTRALVDIAPGWSIGLHAELGADWSLVSLWAEHHFDL